MSGNPIRREISETRAKTMKDDEGVLEQYDEES